MEEEMRLAAKLMMVMVLAAALMLPTLALAEYPEKPITYTIPFNPGGESDVTARLQEPNLEKFLGVSVNVTHKPGGGGAVAWSEFQRTAKPDGYSIIGCNIPHIIGQPMLRKDAGYKTDGFQVIMWFHFTPNALVVPKSSKIKTLKDFIEYAKKNPGAATVGGSGTYSANHLGDPAPGKGGRRQADLRAPYRNRPHYSGPHGRAPHRSHELFHGQRELPRQVQHPGRGR
jgi:tripartite-type tricarboxylate transporter receptor subunit TctC